MNLCRLFSGICLALALFCLFHPPPALAETRSPAELLRLGERMYREGLLPSGEPMQAVVKGDIPVPGTVFSCESCHMRSGLGSIEGTVYTPPTNGAQLFRPRKKYYKGVEIKYNETSERRPEYTDESLAILIRSGVDPSGRVLDDIMPFYLLEAQDMEILVHYLRNLSAEFSPGVTDRQIRFATVLSEGVDPQDRAAMLEALQEFIDYKNGMTRSYKRSDTARDRIMALAMSVTNDLEERTLTLARWELKGPPETWRAQLEELYRAEPVFALLGGLVAGEWEPIHRFSEEHKIPCIFPNTDFPVISSTDWYTQYLSKGFYQEGETVARFLNGAEPAPGGPASGEGAPAGPVVQAPQIVQVVRASREGRALASGFQERWTAFGRAAPPTLALEEGAALTREALARVAPGGAPAAVLLWDGPGAAATLELLARLERPPARVFVSGRYLGQAVWTLPEPVRATTWLSWPYRLPQEPALTMMGDPVVFRVADNLVAQQTYALVELLGMAVMEIKGNYYRDYLLDVVAMSMDRVVPLYERLSFGPGQHYASKGCYVVQLAPGPQPQLVKRSEWTIK